MYFQSGIWVEDLLGRKKLKNYASTGCTVVRVCFTEMLLSYEEEEQTEVRWTSHDLQLRRRSAPARC